MATPTRLTPQQRQSFKDDGYLLVPSLLDPADLAPIAARLADHVRQTVATWAEDPSLDTHGGAVITRFGLADPGLAPCYQHPLVSDAAAAVLADGWHLQALELRAPIPGSGEQGLHQDFGGRGTGPAWQALSAMWCISEFTRDNGPLRVIPGSHLASEPPIDMDHGYATGMGPHPDEVKIIAPAGSVIFVNAPDLWHSGTFNYTPAARLALTACFAPGPPWQLDD
jgi:ectoine hydroxylase-related dioxygenase (phytanoyl-CoA dioxygenase family)